MPAAVEPRDTPPTVFLVAHMGFAARYLLRTDIFSTLKAAGARIVILTPNAGEQYMADEFADTNVTLEPLRVDWNDFSLVTSSRLWSLLFYLRSYTIADGHRSEALQDKYRVFEHVLRARSRALAAGFRLALNGLWRSRSLRRLLLGLETRFFTRPVHTNVFDRYQPDLVVTTSPGWFFPDAVVLREAAARGVSTATVVLSWDNPTSKGYRGADPDRMIVWSKEMARQVAEHHDYPPERIVAAGVPHFDDYVRDGALPTREELGLDTDRRLIVFATGAPATFGANLAVAEALAKTVGSDALGVPSQLVVRLHPLYFRPGHEAPLQEYERLAATYGHTRLDIPDIRSESLTVDMADSDRRRLGALIKNCDVLVNVFSTTTLEAFLVDRPVVLVSSDVDADRAAADGLRGFHDYEHVRPVIDERAAKVARTIPEVLEHVREYLADPTLDNDGRRRVAVRELGPTDGSAGRRVGQSLLGFLGLAPAAEQWAELRTNAPNRP
jgi:CDP-Glycerol:Poly(glycerophosphate) glycerophosphotransferase